MAPINGTSRVTSAHTSRANSVAREIIKKRDKPFKTEQHRVLTKKRKLDIHVCSRTPSWRRLTDYSYFIDRVWQEQKRLTERLQLPPSRHARPCPSLPRALTSAWRAHVRRQRKSYPAVRAQRRSTHSAPPVFPVLTSYRTDHTIGMRRTLATSPIILLALATNSAPISWT